MIRAPSAAWRSSERRGADRRALGLGHDLAPTDPSHDRAPAPARRAPARSRTSASRGRRRRGSSGPRRTRGRDRRGRRRWAPSGSNGRSCGCACPHWTKKYSIESSGAVIRTSSPVSSATSRMAVSSVVSPAIGRALGQGPRRARRARAGGCRRPARGGRRRTGRRRRRPRWRWRSSGAPRRRGGARSCADPRPARRRACRPVHRDAWCARAAAGCTAVERAGRSASRPRRLDERTEIGSSEDRGAPGGSGVKRAGRTKPKSPRRAPDARWADELRRRPGRVLAAMLCCMGRMVPVQAGFARAARRLARAAPVTGRPAPRRGRPRARPRHDRGERRPARAPRARRGARSSVPTSPRVIGPVSADRMPIARALPSVWSIERPVDRERAGLVEARRRGRARRSRRAARRSRRPPAPRRRGRPAFAPGASRTGRAPIASAMSAEERRRAGRRPRGDRRAAQGGDGPFGVGERDERMERPDLGPGRHRRREHLGAERAARVDDRLAAVQPEARRQRGDGVVGHGAG